MIADRTTPSRAAPGAFVLMEVVVAITILAIALTAFMRSFTQSLGAARAMEIKTQAAFFAERMMDEFELQPPPSEKESEGDFGEDYPSFSYRARVEIVEPEYEDQGLAEDQIEQYFAHRQYHLEIRYFDEARMKEPIKAFELDSAVIAFEKFSQESKMSYANY